MSTLGQRYGPLPPRADRPWGAGLQPHATWGTLWGGLLRVHPLLWIALLTDLLTPFLIWKGVLPGFVRWASHGALALMIADTFARMMLRDHIPLVSGLVVGLSAVGVAVAYLGGQGLTATVWGWWVLFQFPLVGLFAYMLEDWPPGLPGGVLRFGLALMGFEVLVQLGQYATGEIPGDNLAGTFGRNGTPDLVMMAILVLCLGLGHWLRTGRWRSLALALLLGAAASVLGEIKVFIPMAVATGVLAMGIFAVQRGQLGRVLQYAALMAVALYAFVRVYDVVVSQARGTRPLSDYLQVETLDRYLSTSERTVIDGQYYYNIGRNYAIVYGWNQIRHDPATLLFGMGLGARGESRTLGTAGAGLQQGLTGLNSGTSLLVMLQELGVVGFGLVLGFLAWVIYRLARDIRAHPTSPLLELRYALVLFTALWPVWLWYTSSWTQRAPLIVYWALVGYVLAEPRRRALATGAEVGQHGR